MSDVNEATRAELCAVALAECFRGDGEILASAIGVLPTLGARLAKLTFAPEILITDGLHYVLENVRRSARRTASSPWSRPGCRIAASSIGCGRGDATW